MICPVCGNSMEMVLYEEGEVKYVHFVCYVCEIEKEENNEISVGMPNEFA